MVMALQITLELFLARDGFMSIGRLSGWVTSLPATEETAYEQHAAFMAGKGRKHQSIE